MATSPQAASPQSLAPTNPSYAAPRTPLEQELAEIWQDVLEMAQIGIFDNFFDLGGHSLLSIEIRAVIKKLLSAPFLKIDFLLTPTIASMAEAIFGQVTSGKEPQSSDK